jgi:tripartite-type tricarboxylate transporter receptor subunit TctC
MVVSTTRRLFLCGAAALPFVAAPTFAWADFPSRPIRIVVSFPPGGGIDILARLMAPKMSERLGQAVIVENRAGANGLIATQSVSQADEDGYTILCGTLGTLSVNQSLYAGRPGTDMAKDFMPLSHIASLPLTLTVHDSVSVKSVKELIEYAKARPGEVLFGSSGIGGLPHLCGELFNAQAGIKTIHVPYRGSSPCFTDLASGRVHFVFDAYAIALPFIQSSNIRLLATTEPTKLKALAGVPPMKDTLPDFNVANWYGMVVRRGTPPAVVSRLNEEVIHALRLPDVAERADALGIEVVGTTPEQFGAFQHKEIARWAEVIRNANIKVE